MPRNRTIRTALVETRIRFEPDGGFRALVKQRFDGQPWQRELRFAGTPEQVARSGGAAMRCPSCRDIRRCDSVMPGQLGLAPHQRVVPGAHPGDGWLRRVRMCRSCFYHFVTAEVSESLILELGERLEGGEGGDADEAADGASVIPFPTRRR